MRLTFLPGLRGAWRQIGRALALAAVLGPLAACDPEELLEASRPSIVEAEKLNDPSQAQLLLNGVIADFECAHGAFVAASAIMGDELEDAQLAAAVWDYDRRSFTANPGGSYGPNPCNAQLFGVYRPLATALWVADDLVSRLDSWTDEQVAERTLKIATASLYGGFAALETGMIMCAGAINIGPELNSQQFFTEAEARFTRAIEEATAIGEDAEDILHAAYAGRARARLYLGGSSLAGAASDARQVPAGFVFEAGAANDPNGRRWNRIFHFVNLSRFHMVAAESRNLTTGGVPDPRTTSRVAEDEERAVDGRVSIEQTKYTGLTDPIPVTRYEEAQLILAEADPTTTVAVINSLRAAHSLPPMSATELANLQATLIEERRRELWLEGPRMYDIRRFNLPLVPAQGSTFGKGGFYGNTVCLPLPDVERLYNPCIAFGRCD